MNNLLLDLANAPEADRMNLLNKWLMRRVNREFNHTLLRLNQELGYSRKSFISAYRRQYSNYYRLYKYPVLHLSPVNCDTPEMFTVDINCYYVDHSGVLRFQKHQYRKCPLIEDVYESI